MNEITLQWYKDRPTYKRLREWEPSLIPLIIERHPSLTNKRKGFLHRIIKGYMGYGKTTLAYKLMAKLDYTLNGYTKVDEEEYSYKFAVDNIIYRPDELFGRMSKALDNGYPDWIWTLDDCSIHMGKQIYRNDRSTHDKLETKLPAIREYVTCLLITTPKMKNLAKPFRDFFDWSVKITLEEGGISQNMRRGKHYYKEEYPDEVHYAMYHPYDDRYSCLVPDEFYKWIDDKKRAALKEYDNWAENRKIVDNEDVEDEEESDAQL